MDTTAAKLRCRRIDWNAQPLGCVTDKELARRLRVSQPTVGYQRIRRGIPPYCRPIDWALVPLGRVDDEIIAAELDVALATVAKQRRWLESVVRRATAIDWDAQPLGQMLDRELADQLGIPTLQVAVARLKRGIPSFFRRKLRVIVDWDAQPLGEMPDRALAEELGVSERTVQRARLNRGIMGFSDPRRMSPPSSHRCRVQTIDVREHNGGCFGLMKDGRAPVRDQP